MAGAITASVVHGNEVGADPLPSQRHEQFKKPHPVVKAFCIDFNWHKGRATDPPDVYAHADPAEHVRWYLDQGVNTIQTFCVSYNGYAWYPSEVAPITPNLKHPDFLGEMVRLGHNAGLQVMGYFTIGANPHWEKRHSELAHADYQGTFTIPFTLEYLDYFCR